MISVPRLLRLMGLYSLAALLGCATVMKPVRKVSRLGGEVSVNVTIDDHSNRDMPIAVDILAVADGKTLKDVAAMTAQQWFQKRSNYMRLHPSVLELYSWEWVPGQQVAPIRVPRTTVAAGIVLFANYATPGEHSAMLPANGTVRLDLGPQDLRISRN